MKIEWSVPNVIHVESLDRAELAIMGVIFGVFARFRPFCGRGATL